MNNSSTNEFKILTSISASLTPKSKLSIKSFEPDEIGARRPPPPRPPFKWFEYNGKNDINKGASKHFSSPISRNEINWNKENMHTGVQRVPRSLADLSLPRKEKPWLPGERT